MFSIEIVKVMAI